jgi:hypothetical protein
MTDAFTVNEFVEPATDKVHRIYKYKRRPCTRVVLSSRIAAQLAGYHLIEKDLRSVKVWLEELDKHGGEAKKRGYSFRGTDRDKYNIVKGLFVASLTFYGKCFSKCEGRPVKLERAQLEDRFRELHDECISYRHNFAAHSGAKRLERVEIALVYPTKFKKVPPFEIFKELDQPDTFWPAEGEVTLVELVEHVRSIAQRKIEFLSNKVLQDDVMAKSTSLWPTK